MALVLSFLTYAFVGGAIRLCLPPLFPEISSSLNLTKTQIGTIWGMDPFAGFFVSLWAGLLIDRFGIRRTLSAVCILAGVGGALRSLCSSFFCLSWTMFFFGLFAAMIPTMGPKVVSTFFMGRHLGSVNGLMQLAMTGGAILGTLFSASVFSPLLGGWRYVLVLYSLPPIVIGLFWLFMGRQMEEAKGAFFGVPMMEALPLVIRRREVWAIGIAMMGMQTAFVGITGYLPTFLRDIGWRPIYADSALSIFTAISAASALPVSLFSDRIGSRKTVLIPSLLLGSASMMCFPLRHTLLLWILILLNGVLRGGLFPLFVALIVEQKGIGPRYAGTAVGTITSLGMLAGFLSQPLGMYFAGTFRGAGAFVVWGVICFVSLFALFLVEEEK